MNLNHIAKKPFFDLFYAKPCMASLLRAAVYDASFLNSDNTIRGPCGSLMLSGQQTVVKSKELKDAMA
jgi:L-ascorbate peroxidase